MTNYDSIRKVLSNPEAEIHAKAILFAELLAFFEKFDARRLTGSFLVYILAHHYAEQRRSNLKKPVYKKKWTNSFYKTIKN